MSASFSLAGHAFSPHAEKHGLNFSFRILGFKSPETGLILSGFKSKSPFDLGLRLSQIHIRKPINYVWLVHQGVMTRQSQVRCLYQARSAVARKQDRTELTWQHPVLGREWVSDKHSHRCPLHKAKAQRKTFKHTSSAKQSQAQINIKKVKFRAKTIQ